jgi:N,N-dimethylformamidase
MTTQGEKKDPSMKVVGYTDRLSVRPGQKIKFMVSCEGPRYRADIVRLIHGDTNPKGPGFKEEEIETSVSREHAGRVQKIYKGSFVTVPDAKKLKAVRSFTILAWIYPTTPLGRLQGVLTRWTADDGAGYGLFINERGEASLRLAARGSRVEELSSGVALRPRTWYFVAATYDSATGRSLLRQQPADAWPIDDTRVTKEAVLSRDATGPSGARLLIAAYHDSSLGKNRAGGFFNGKIESPMLFGTALTPEALHRVEVGRKDAASRRELIAEWDFSVGFSSATATDVSPHRLHGTVVNTPTRAVPGHSWTGQKTNFNESPREFGAIHFHEDDLEDARWEVDFEFRIPDSMQSGVYAARLRTEGGEDYLPFFVGRKRGTPTAPVALLLPTYSYLAYANIHTMLEGAQDVLFTLPGLKYPSQPQEVYMVENRITGLYDSHTDGTGFAYTSRLKPIVNMRPKYTETVAYNGRGSPHQLSADLHLLDWLEAKDIRFDVITDEDLNREGTKALADYRVVVSGSHPEYWTERMLDSLQTYLGDGGRFMYMGGNGLYWVISVDPARPHVIELRRWGGTGTWLAGPGEYYHSTTGELGGLWRNRGRSPQRLVGTGMTSSIEGIKEENRPYRREKGSFDPRAAFIFDGIGKDELIGDFPNLVGGSGAAGFEIDRLDYALGTPPHTLLLATASGFEGDYQGAMEDATVANLKVPNVKDPNIRADMVYLEYPKGGAVFSTGSIAWCGCLSYNGYQNNVSRITENVLRGFSKP